MRLTPAQRSAGIAALSIAALLAASALVAWVRGQTEPASRERLAEARERWRRSLIVSYDLDLEMTGSQTGLYHVEVRDGKVSRITRNGQPANPSDAEYWSIDGWFMVIDEELDKADLSARAPPGEECQTWVRVRYDPQRGYPTRLIRQEKQPSRRSPTGLEASGSSMSVDVRVLKFEPR